MPEVSYWESLFDIELILSEMQINSSVACLIEVGSGYGTFTIPAAKLISGQIYAYDIEEEMNIFLYRRLLDEQISNVIVAKKDVLEDDIDVASNTADYIMLFNIMHYEKPLELLQKSYSLLASGGKVGIIHWRSDIETPRGPDVSIRPKPQDIRDLLDQNQFTVVEEMVLNPYHYGIIGQKKIKNCYYENWNYYRNKRIRKSMECISFCCNG